MNRIVENLLVALLFAVVSAAGCANENKSVAANRPITTPKTDQDSAAQGTYIRIDRPVFNNYVINGEDGRGSGRDEPETTQPSDSLTGLSDEGGPVLARATGRRTQAGTHITNAWTITTGGVTPTLTGTTTGNGGGSLTQNPTATQRPDTSLSANAGAAFPGGNVKQDATTAKSGGEGAGGEISQSPHTDGSQTASNTQTTTTSRPVTIAPPPLPTLPAPPAPAAAPPAQPTGG